MENQALLTAAGAIFLASLAGSVHCAGMCGGFVTFYSGESAGSERWVRHLAYHCGRLVTYLLLGAAAGVIGGGISWIGSLAGFQHIVLWALGLVMIILGARTLLNLSIKVPLPSRLVTVHSRLFKPLYGRIRGATSSNPLTLAIGLGLLSTFLPCGWLYLNVMAASAAGTAAGGALLMTFFWVGTVPILVALGETVNLLSGRLKLILPRVTACLLIAAGIYALTVHHQAFPSSDKEHHHCCDDG